MTKAVKNGQRLSQILFVFARHGFLDVVDRLGLRSYVQQVDTANDADKSIPERLREACEELGPTFVKFGQLLSMRTDLLPQAFIDEFIKLQDSVKPLPFSVIEEALVAELGRPWSDFFASLQPEPLGSASIAQVHEARLHDGASVVVKVQRPGVKKIIEVDISLLTFLAEGLEKLYPEIQVLSPRRIVEEFSRTLLYELDYCVEANNVRKITKNMRHFDAIKVPKVYKEYSTSKILVLEKLIGIRLNDKEQLKRIDCKKIAQVGARAFFQSILVDGLFHADLHAGNLFIVNETQLGVIDFGIVGRLSQRARDQLAHMCVALLTEDYEALCYEYAELGGKSIDIEAFQREIRLALAPYVGLSLAEMNIGRILTDATRIAAGFQIQVPIDWMLVFKAIIMIESMGRMLDPELDFMLLGEELTADLVRHQYSIKRLGTEGAFVLKDLMLLTKTLPRHIRWMMRRMVANDFALELRSPDMRALRDTCDLGSKRIATSLLASSCLIAATFSTELIQKGLYGCAVFFSAQIVFDLWRQRAP